MKETIEIRRWDNDEVIFSHTRENNTIYYTIKEAINQGVSLAYAYLHGHSICFIDFSDVDLSYADLSNCFFFNSILKKCKLNGANLANAIFQHVSLSHEQLIDAKGINDQCPKEGSFIGWKKCVLPNNDDFDEEYIVKLEIPADAKRCSGTDRKCRCSKAKVLEIQNIDGTIANIDYVYSEYNNCFSYSRNKIVYADSFDNRFWVECSHGIHFFMNRQDAVDYDFF